MFKYPSSNRLSSFISGRDNNFNLIRIIAAFCVLITHSFALSGYAEPLRHSLGMTIGTISVDIFFLTSGFLVTASLLTRQSTVDFAWARFLRIFPALFVMLVLTIFVFGFFFTTLSKASYFSDPLICKYFIKCFTLVTGVHTQLPGVFYNNPYKIDINGSLWTMPFEVKMYIILAVIWAALSSVKNIRPKIFKTVIVSIAVISCIWAFKVHFIQHSNSNWAHLLFMFFTGSSFFILRNRIILSRTIFIISIIALFSATINFHAFFIVYTLTLAYILFFIAFIPRGFIRGYNKLGDYSYGTYIYAFPIQQSIVFLMPSISVLKMIIISSIITFAFAFLSWHLIEKHALRLKDYFIIHTKLLLKGSLAKVGI